MPQLSVTLLQAALFAYAFGAGLGVVLWRRDKAASGWAFGAAGAGGLMGLAASISALARGAENAEWSMPLGASFIPHVEWTIRFDGLGAFFTLILSIAGLAVSVYSIGYGRGFLGRKNVAALGALYNLLLLAVQLVFVAWNAFFFLITWEVMALAAFCLVSFEHEQAEARNAGVLYFVMSHLGTGCLLLAFLLLFQASGDYSFSSFHQLGGRLSSGTQTAVFLLFLAGFGVKAGLVPLHIWLPAAHPVAPSNVSALLSGVIIKTGIYGITRVCFDFMGAPQMWWGVLVLSIGTVSAVLGVLYALMEHDLKRLLAYHSIENIGIILMGLGAALMFLNTGHRALAALALIAAMFHTINHALFKALLFLGAGAVLHATHSRNMEELGGLARRMPHTALCFLIGAVAISALPPLNGFVSEWLTYQSLLQGFETTGRLLRLLFPMAGAMLALTSALAAACFVKAFGITFLAQPRTTGAAEAKETAISMRAGQFLLAAICVVLGLFPAYFLRLLDPVTLPLTGQALSQPLTLSNGFVLGNLSSKGGTVSTLGIALLGLSFLSVPLILRVLLSRGTKVRIGPAWDCGLRGLTPHMAYSATGFSKPIRMVFKALFRPRREVQREYDYSPYFAKTIRFESHVEEVFEKRVYRPFHRIVLRFSRRMRALQAGSIQAYLVYIFLTLLGLLIYAL